jgi:hypothetical protein
MRWHVLLVLATISWLATAGNLTKVGASMMFLVVHYPGKRVD